MHRYILRRFLISLPTVFLVLTFIFFLVRVVPGDPALAILGDQASEEALQSFREEMGLNEPLIVQYGVFLSGLFRLDFGRSMITGIPIINQLLFLMPYTLELTFAGLFIGILFGIPLGIISGVYRNRGIDYFFRALSMSGLSIPAFVTGLFLIAIFSVRLGWFPVISSGRGVDLATHLRQIVLPAFTLGLEMTAFTTRVTRGSLIEVMFSDYIRTARSKGLTERVVIYKHALRNAFIPVITFAGLYLSVIIGGTVLTEIIFSRPGLGSMIVGSMSRRDYNSLQSLLVVFSFLVVLVNIVTDISYGFFDPRIKYN